MSVYATLSTLKGFLSPKSRSGKASVVNLTLSLHKYTAVILLGCSILVTSKQFFGDNINCMVPGPMDKKVFESFCFMKYTFTMPPPQDITEEQFAHKELYAHPGVAKSPDSLYRYEEDSHVFHNYYQWVCFVLFLQAVACYLPWFCWKLKEGGLVAKLLANVSGDPLEKKSLEEQLEGLTEYLANNSKQFDSKARFLLLTQMANLVMVVAQMYIMDIFLGGEFLSMGIAHILDFQNRHNFMEQVFPKVTKCSMKTFGVSGKVVEHGGLCTLPINIVNEKIYTALWFWFVLLASWSLLVIALELIIFAFPCLRKSLFRTRFNFIPAHPIRHVLSHSTYGDYILLNIIGANVDNHQMRHLVISVSDRYGPPDTFSSTLPMYARQDTNHSTVKKINGSIDLRMRNHSDA